MYRTSALGPDEARQLRPLLAQIGWVLLQLCGPDHGCYTTRLWSKAEVTGCFKPPNLRRMGQRRWSLALPRRPMSRIVLSCLILSSPNVGYQLPAFLCSPWVVILPFLCLHHRGPSEDLGPELSIGSMAQPALVSAQSLGPLWLCKQALLLAP